MVQGLNSTARGFTNMTVVIDEVTSAGMALARDQYNRAIQIPIGIQASKGPLPQAGEIWQVSKGTTGSWVFVNILNNDGGGTIPGDLTMAGTNTLSGENTLSGPTTVSGAATLSGNTAVTGPATFSNSATFTGAVNLPNGLTVAPVVISPKNGQVGLRIDGSQATGTVELLTLKDLSGNPILDCSTTGGLVITNTLLGAWHSVFGSEIAFDGTTNPPSILFPGGPHFYAGSSAPSATISTNPTVGDLYYNSSLHIFYTCTGVGPPSTWVPIQVADRMRLYPSGSTQVITPSSTAQVLNLIADPGYPATGAFLYLDSIAIATAGFYRLSAQVTLGSTTAVGDITVQVRQNGTIVRQGIGGFQDTLAGTAAISADSIRCSVNDTLTLWVYTDNAGTNTVVDDLTQTWISAVYEGQ